MEHSIETVAQEIVHWDLWRTDVYTWKTYFRVICGYKKEASKFNLEEKKQQNSAKKMELWM